MREPSATTASARGIQMNANRANPSSVHLRTAQRTSHSIYWCHFHRSTPQKVMVIVRKPRPLRMKNGSALGS
eukprot:scaffold218378_cov17-Prasinocladus_malaysianus.AAC.1